MHTRRAFAKAAAVAIVLAAFPTLASAEHLPGHANIVDSQGKFVTADMDSANKMLIANRAEAKGWELFDLIELGDDKVEIRGSNGKFVSADGNDGLRLNANRDVAAAWEKFTVIRNSDGTVTFRAWNGKYVSADRQIGGALVANRDKAEGWEKFSIIKR